MARFWDGLAGTLLVLWVGSLLALGAIVAPILFASLEDKQLAGMLAGKMFVIGAWVGIVAGFYLLLYRLVRDGVAAMKTLFFWGVLLMLLLTLAGHFGVQPILENLKHQALPLAVMQSVFADRFAQWHGISRVLWLLQSALGLLLIWRAGLAR